MSYNKKKKENKARFYCKKMQNDPFKNAPNSILKGFIIMCDLKREKNAVKEAYNYLNEEMEILYPNIQAKQIQPNDESANLQKKVKENQEQEMQQKEQKTENEEEKKISHTENTVLKDKQVPEPEKNEGNLVEDQLKKELDQLNNQSEKYFYNIDTNVNCIVFIKINPLYDIDPYVIVNSLMEKVHVKQKQISRYSHRIIPVEYAFTLEKTQLNDQITKLIKNNIPEDVPHGWMSEFKCRNNSKYNKTQIQNIITPLMQKHYIEYKTPEYVINIEIMQKLVGLSVLKNYFLYKKYSLKTSSQVSEVQETTKNNKLITNQNEQKSSQEKPGNQQLSNENQNLSTVNSKEPVAVSQKEEKKDIQENKSDNFQPNQQLIQINNSKNENDDDIQLI